MGFHDFDKHIVHTGDYLPERNNFCDIDQNLNKVIALIPIEMLYADGIFVSTFSMPQNTE